MISQRPPSNNHFLVLVGLALMGCNAPVQQPPDASASPPPPSRVAPDATSAPIPEVIIEGGGRQLDLDAIRVGFDEARILESWRAARLAPLEALEDQGLRRRVVRTVLETHVLRAEFVRRGLAVDGERYDELVRKAALGVKPDKPISRERLQGALPDDEIDALLVARFESPAAHVRRVVLDLVEREQLTLALVDALEARAMEQDWRDQKTTLEVDLVRIPRVPTPPEIDRVVAAEPQALATYYQQNQRLFKRSERVFVRRLALPLKSPQDIKEVEAAKSRAVALRTKVEGGADMVALVTEHGSPVDRRNRGRMSLTPKQEPTLFGLDKGTLTPVSVLGEAVGFYRIEGYAPAMERTLSDPRVKRESGAAILRETDRLPHAKGIAQQVRSFLQKSDEAGLTTLVKNRRLRRAKTPAFSLAGRNRIPTIGLAPTLFEAVFKLRSKGDVTDIITVRQDYVVARLLRRQQPEMSTWAAARAGFRPQWRARVRPMVVDRWLTSQFSKARLRVDKKRLDALSIEELRVRSGPVSP